MEFRDLKTQYRLYKDEIDNAIQNVLSKGTFIGGEEVITLENRLAEYTGTRHCISCANGTEAMSLVLMAWEIGVGDAVFVPDFTFFSTAEVVAFCGATPIFVDVDKNTFNIDAAKLESEINRVLEEGKLIPKVIIPVDLFGLPANFPEIKKIANKFNLMILEDAAQGFGGRINGEKAGSFGDASTTSFFPAKPLGCYGDGGAIFTDDDDLSLLLKSLKVHGKGHNKYDNVRIGINSRLDTIQAAILNVKLSAFIKHELDGVNRVAEIYNCYISQSVEIPFIPDGYYSSYAQYTIRCSSKVERDQLQSILKHQGIPSMVYYPKPLHRQSAFSSQLSNEFDYVVTNELCDTVLSLPIHPYLTEEEVYRVIQSVK